MGGGSGRGGGAARAGAATEGDPGKRVRRAGGDLALGKRLLASRGARVLAGLALRAYRAFMYGGFLFRHDPRLVAMLRSGAPAILACWHQDFLYTMGYLSRWNPARRTYVLASASRDGGLAAGAAEGVGYRKAVRGSSARGGAGALLRLHRLARGGRASVAVVCDGPRPPARRLQPGILHLARETGLPIWLVRTSYRPVRTLERTWARFQIPRPGSRAVSLADGPIHVPAGLDRAGLEGLRLELEARLDRLAERAEGLAEGWARGERPPPSPGGAGTVPPLP